MTREITERSTPAIEQLLRNAIQEDTAVAIDSVLLDANAATTIRPAGLRNGITTAAGTAGGGIAAVTWRTSRECSDAQHEHERQPASAHVPDEPGTGSRLVAHSERRRRLPVRAGDQPKPLPGLRRHSVDDRSRWCGHPSGCGGLLQRNRRRAAVRRVGSGRSPHGGHRRFRSALPAHRTSLRRLCGRCSRPTASRFA
jgi:hypothetical protein